METAGIILAVLLVIASVFFGFGSGCVLATDESNSKSSTVFGGLVWSFIFGIAAILVTAGVS